jgi:hypothetical protein
MSLYPNCLKLRWSVTSLQIAPNADLDFFKRTPKIPEKIGEGG